MARTVQTREEAVQLFREMGLIGAGGAGFPTYFKYLTPTEILIVNCEEGEPGYEADKILLLSRADSFAEIFDALRRLFGFKEILIGAKDKDQAKLAPLESRFTVRYTPSQYGMGEERWLTKAVTGREVPPDKIPPQVGVTVNNVETVYWMYQALFHGRPVIEKYVNVYGEVGEQRVVLAPVGAYVVDLLARVGVDTSRSPKLMVVDGGPLMGDRISGEARWMDQESGDFATEPRSLGLASVTKRTNGLLVAESALYTADQMAFRQRPGEKPPVWEDTLPECMRKLGLERYLEWSPKPEDVLDLRDRVSRVRIKLNQDGPRCRPSVPVVRPGDRVRRGQLIAKPLEGPIHDFKLLSVAQHASIDGVVQEVTDDAIVIVRE